MRTLAAVWTALLGVGLGLNVVRRCWPPDHKPPAAQAPCQYTANRALPSNFRLNDADWSSADPRAPSLTGKYANRAFTPNACISSSEVLRSPQISAGGLNIVALNVSAGPLNAGAQVDIYRNRIFAARNVPVLAVLCGAKDCQYVLVGIRDSDLPAVTDGDATPVLLIRHLP